MKVFVASCKKIINGDNTFGICDIFYKKEEAEKHIKSVENQYHNGEQTGNYYVLELEIK
jgi:hypothetical protein